MFRFICCYCRGFAFCAILFLFITSGDSRNIVTTIGEMFLGQSAQSEVRPQKLAIIGAGASRTGTQSITEALHILGFNVYNLVGIMQNQHVQETVLALQDPAASPPLFEKVLDGGYTATLDTPMNLLWRQQMARFPDGKVLLSVRDSTESWLRSFQWAGEAFAPLSHSRPWKWIANLTPLFEEIELHIRQAGDGKGLNCSANKQFVRPWWAPWVEYLDSQAQTPACLVRYYDGLRDQVRAAVPSKNLLEFNVKQGWEPLCAFLNVAIPAQPFPNVNSTRELVIGYWFLRAVCWLYPFLLIGPIACLLCCRCVRPRAKGKVE